MLVKYVDIIEYCHLSGGKFHRRFYFYYKEKKIKKTLISLPKNAQGHRIQIKQKKKKKKNLLSWFLLP
jgi:hypothetical protein